MKTLRLFDRWEVKYHLSIQKVKRIEITIPDWADDAHLRHGLHDGGKDQESWSATPDGEDKVVYYKGCTAFYIDVPKCKRSVEVSCTPLHDMTKRKAGISPDHYSDRKVVIDLFY